MFEPRIIDFNERLNNLYEFILDVVNGNLEKYKGEKNNYDDYTKYLYNIYYRYKTDNIRVVLSTENKKLVQDFLLKLNVSEEEFIQTSGNLKKFVNIVKEKCLKIKEAIEKDNTKVVEVKDEEKTENTNIDPEVEKKIAVLKDKIEVKQDRIAKYEQQLKSDIFNLRPKKTTSKIEKFIIKLGQECLKLEEEIKELQGENLSIELAVESTVISKEVSKNTIDKSEYPSEVLENIEEIEEEINEALKRGDLTLVEKLKKIIESLKKIKKEPITSSNENSIILELKSRIEFLKSKLKYAQSSGVSKEKENLKQIEDLEKEITLLKDKVQNNEELLATIEQLQAEVKKLSDELSSEQTKNAISSQTILKLEAEQSTLLLQADATSRKIPTIRNVILDLLFTKTTGITINDIENKLNSMKLNYTKKDIFQIMSAVQSTIPGITLKYENGTTIYSIQKSDKSIFTEAKAFDGGEYSVSKILNGVVYVLHAADMHMPLTYSNPDTFRDEVKRKLDALYEYATLKNATFVPGGDLFGDKGERYEDCITKNMPVISKIYHGIEMIGEIMANSGMDNVMLLGNHGVHPLANGIDAKKLLEESSEGRCIVLGTNAGTLKISHSTIGLFHKNFPDRYMLTHFNDFVYNDLKNFLGNVPTTYNIFEHFHGFQATPFCVCIDNKHPLLFKYVLRDGQVDFVEIQPLSVPNKVDKYGYPFVFDLRNKRKKL